MNALGEAHQATVIVVDGIVTPGEIVGPQRSLLLLTGLVTYVGL